MAGDIWIGEVEVKCLSTGRRSRSLGVHECTSLDWAQPGSTSTTTPNKFQSHSLSSLLR
jgi:hypothetical protein